MRNDKSATSAGITGLLLFSVMANIALLAGITVLCYQLRNIYTDYRHFRALPQGTSEASTLATASVSDRVVVMFGDSRVSKWQPLPEAHGAIYINAGIAGETTTEMQRRFERDVLRHKPDIVVIQAGINDLTAAATHGIMDSEAITAAIETNIEHFCATLRDNGSKVLLTAILPNKKLSLIRRQFWASSLDQSVSDSNSRLQQIAEKTGAVWLDASTLVKTANGDVDASFYTDTLHLNTQGYRVLNNTLEASISRLWLN